MQRILRMSRFRVLAGLVAGVIILMGAGDDSTRIERLGHQMVCVCGACNQYLLDCNHVGCAYSSRMRQELRAAVDNGKNDSSVLQFFVEKYGATVLAAPTKTGFDRVAWIIPYLALILGVGGLVLLVSSWHNRRTRTPRSDVGSKGSPEFDRFRAQARKETEL
ncbi:MAG TPA: cytochrome c-type biogenesis protein CcmH [Terriglobales bacterium]|nr:cytochrome c-type biogenesis protein CcmH [Terriglobales bacterium]